MTPKLKPPRAKRLKPNCDILLLISAFKFNLRRYSWDAYVRVAAAFDAAFLAEAQKMKVEGLEAGAYTRLLFG